VTFLFVYEISQELLNGFAPNSQGGHVWSLAWSLAQGSLNVMVKGQVKVKGQRSRSPGTKNEKVRHFSGASSGAWSSGALRAVYV